MGDNERKQRENAWVQVVQAIWMCVRRRKGDSVVSVTAVPGGADEGNACLLILTEQGRGEASMHSQVLPTGFLLVASCLSLGPPQRDSIKPEVVSGRDQDREQQEDTR